MINIIDTLMILPGIVIGLSFHEFGHALVANLLGDPTAKRLGRLTIDPKKHIDPLGLITLALFRFGWGKPVPVDERNFKRPGLDGLLVSIAGPIMNLLVAIVFLLIYKVMVTSQMAFLYTRIGDIILQMVIYGMQINVVLMIFNLLPIPPLDGYHVLSGIGNFREKGIHYQLYEKGRYILLAIIAANILGLNILGRIIGPPIEFVTSSLINIIL